MVLKLHINFAWLLLLKPYPLCRCGRKTQQYTKNMWRLGNYKAIELSSSISALLHPVCGCRPERALKFWRLQLHNTVFCSQEYSRTRSRNSYTITFGSDGRFGVIKYFLETKNSSNESVVVAIVSILRAQKYYNLPHLFTARASGILQAIRADTIIFKCVSMCPDTPDSHSFIGVFPCSILPFLT